MLEKVGWRKEKKRKTKSDKWAEISESKEKERYTLVATKANKRINGKC